MTTPGSKDTIAEIIRDFGKIPSEMRQEARPRLKRSADLVVAEAKRNASWSTRIPDAIRTRAMLAKRKQGVTIYVRSAKAPHGRALEGVGTRGNTFRHPVFGRDKWVEQKKRPFIFPAVVKHSQSVRDAIDEAVAAAARKLGWRDGIR